MFIMKSFSRSLLRTVLFLCTTVTALPSSQQDPYSVKTTSGTVIGHESPKAQGVREYLGIRYGETTAGQHRFMPPRRYRGDGEIVADSFTMTDVSTSGCPAVAAGAMAIMNNLGLADIIPKKISEDCLYANVWVKSQSTREKKPVMLYVYGGAFAIGDSSTSTYHGAQLAAEQDVVVVSVNYRMNIFGFPGAPGLKHLNPAFLDQRMGVEWVRDNIEAFGGDPKKILLFGQSAGSSSVDVYAYAWPDDPIVHAIIGQSGTAMLSLGGFQAGPAERSKAWYQVAKTLGCGDSERKDQAVLRCVQGKSMKEIQNALPTGDGNQAITGFFGPTPDNQTVFSDIYERAKQGRVARVPTIFGSNYNESLIFRTMGLNGEQALTMDKDFRCTTADTVRARTMNGIPAWRYMYTGTYTRLANVGAIHGQELSAVFGSPKTGFQKWIQDTWASFADNPVECMKKLQWPQYGPQGRDVMVFGTLQADQPKVEKAAAYDNICSPSPLD